MVTTYLEMIPNPPHFIFIAVLLNPNSFWISELDCDFFYSSWIGFQVSLYFSTLAPPPPFPNSMTFFPFL